MNNIVRLLDYHPTLNETITQQLGHVAQIVPLRVKRIQTGNPEHSTTTKTLIVTNTHLFYHADASHIRVIQGFLIARRLATILNREKQRKSKSSRVVGVAFCGDLNSGLMDAAGELLVNKYIAKNSKNLQNHLNFFDYSLSEESQSESNLIDA